MSYKWMYKRFVSILLRPSQTWEEIAREDEGGDVLSSYFYPLMGLAGLVSFIAYFVVGYVGDASQPFALFKDAIIGCCVTCVPVFLSFFVSAFVLGKVARSLFGVVVAQSDIYRLLGYSMTVLFVTYTVLAFPIDFKILVWLCQVYTIFLVWEGCGRLFDFDDNRRLVFTVMAFLSEVVVAGGIYYLFCKFM